MLCKPDLRSICLSGGGIAGMVHVGVLERLEREKLLKRIDTFVATSIGTVISVLLVIGYTPLQIKQTLIDIDETALKFSSIDTFFMGYGMDSGEYFMAHIVDKFIEKNISPLVTFKELFLLTGTRLFFTGTNVSTHSTLYFNKDENPDLKVLDAVRISIGIPFILTAVKHDESLFVDGGVTDNFPFEFCLKDFREKNESDNGVIGICTGSLPPRNIVNVEDFVYNVFACTLNVKDSAYKNDKRVIFVPLSEFSSLDFSADETQKHELFILGQNAAEKYISELSDATCTNIKKISRRRSM